MFCAVVRAGVRCCVCALLGLRVARAPCPGVLLRRRGDTPSLWRARLAAWRALLAPGCGPVRGSGVCVRWGGGGFGFSPLVFPALSLCPFSPACPACLPSSYPLGWPWLDGWSWWSDMVFLSCRAAWGGFSFGADCSCGVPCRVYGVLGLLAPVQERACPVCRVACAVSWAAWLLFTGVHALCVVLCVRCPGPPGSCSPVCTLCVWCCVYGVLRPPGSCSPVFMLCVWCCVYGVLGLLAPVHRCARSVRGVACTVSWASWLLFTGLHALCVVLRVRCPGPPGSCSPVCTLCVWCCVYGVLGLLAPVHRCARSVCRVACTASWASWLLFTSVHALCVVLRVRCPGPPGSCSLLCTLCVWCCVYGVLGLLAPVHRCARSVCGVVCTVSWASWLLFTGVHALWMAFRVRCPGPPGSCSPVCTLCVWCCVYGVLGLLAPVHRCARSVCGVACTVSWAFPLPFTGVHAMCVVLRVRCPGPPGSCSPVCTLCVWCCVYGLLGLMAPVHRSARSVSGVACTVSWTSWLLFTGVHALCVALRVQRPWPPGSCSPVCTLRVWCCVYGVLGLLAPVHRCAPSVCDVACTASWASWLLFTGVHALCVVLCARCPGPPGSCSPVCTLCVRCCVCGVLGLLAPVLWCACSLCCVVCAAFWASWLLSSGVSALGAVSCVWSPGLFGPFVLVCSRGLCCVVCMVSWDTWFVFSGVAVWCGVCGVWCAVLRVRCPGPPGPCSPVRTPGVLCSVGGVLGRLAPVHRCACAVCCVVCEVSWASWLLFTGVCARCAVFCVWCTGPSGSRSPVRLCCALRGVCGVPGHSAPVHRCARVAFVVSRIRCPGPRGSRSLACRVLVRCVVCCLRCLGPRGSCSPVCVLGVLRGVCGVGVGACSRAPYRCSDVADSLFLLTHG